MTLLSTAQRLLAKHKACIFNHSAHLLWRSHAWHPDNTHFTDTEQHRCLGNGWQEFIAEHDLPNVIAWLISPCAETPIRFSCMSPQNAHTVTCHWRKIKHGPYWLVMGSYV